MKAISEVVSRKVIPTGTLIEVAAKLIAPDELALGVNVGDQFFEVMDGLTVEQFMPSLVDALRRGIDNAKKVQNEQSTSQN